MSAAPTLVLAAPLAVPNPLLGYHPTLLLSLVSQARPSAPPPPSPAPAPAPFAAPADVKQAKTPEDIKITGTFHLSHNKQHKCPYTITCYAELANGTQTPVFRFKAMLTATPGQFRKLGRKPGEYRYYHRLAPIGFKWRKTTGSGIELDEDQTLPSVVLMKNGSIPISTRQSSPATLSDCQTYEESQGACTYVPRFASLHTHTY